MSPFFGFAPRASPPARRLASRPVAIVLSRRAEQFCSRGVSTFGPLLRRRFRSAAHTSDCAKNGSILRQSDVISWQDMAILQHSSRTRSITLPAVHAHACALLFANRDWVLRESFLKDARACNLGTRFAPTVNPMEGRLPAATRASRRFESRYLIGLPVRLELLVGLNLGT